MGCRRLPLIALIALGSCYLLLESSFLLAILDSGVTYVAAKFKNRLRSRFKPGHK